jgi:hypothetical protein
MSGDGSGGTATGIQARRLRDWDLNPNKGKIFFSYTQCLEWHDSEVLTVSFPMGMVGPFPIRGVKLTVHFQLL